jgi:hypothetical protein
LTLTRIHKEALPPSPQPRAVAVCKLCYALLWGLRSPRMAENGSNRRHGAGSLGAGRFHATFLAQRSSRKRAHTLVRNGPQAFNPEHNRSSSLIWHGLATSVAPIPRL